MNWALREKRKGRRAGLREKKRAMGRRKGGPAGWAANWVWAGFSFLFLGFPFLSYLTHHSIYFNSNSNLNSNLALKQKRTMHQHECNNKFLNLDKF